MKHVLFIGLSIVAATLCGETLTDTNGRSIEVEILQVGEDSVDVRRADGMEFTIPFSSLNAESKERLQKATEPQTEEYDFSTLNKILGLKLWNDLNLWDDDVDEVARRLGWPKESKTDTQSSYRVYFRGETSIGGAGAHTAVLYGQNDKVDYISIMFANKGDSVRSKDVEDVQDALREVNDAIEEDLDALSTSFEPLGEPENETGGVSRGMKERALRWDLGNNSFWLASVEDEYIALRIMPPELADNWGKPEYQSDASVRNAAGANVHENELGDVLIKNIPMVNQGPKGYCVPATMERCLRYMGIRADMYTLAMAGSTTVGGGTSLSNLIEGTSSYVRRNSRKMRTINSKISIKTISKYIDEGQPLMWSMNSTGSYNNLANQITKKRASAKDPKEWRSTLNDISRDAPEVQNESNSAHLCMIVGYNDYTDEIAVSDSWGPNFELRWITEDAAATVSHGRFYVIDF